MAREELAARASLVQAAAGDPWPGRRQDHGAAVLAELGEVWSIGGFDGKVALAEVWALNAQNLEWRRVEAEEGCPALFYHATAVLRGGDGPSPPAPRIMCFGGQTGLGSAELPAGAAAWVLDTAKLCWHQPRLKPGSRWPKWRFGCASATGPRPGSAVVLGGCMRTQDGKWDKLDDAWVLDVPEDLAAASWEFVKCVKNAREPFAGPTRRQGHAAARVFVGGVEATCVFGGEADADLQGATLLELREDGWHWRRPSVGCGTPPAPRFRHSLCAVSAAVVAVLGGMGGPNWDIPIKEEVLHLLDLEQGEWTELPLRGDCAGRTRYAGCAGLVPERPGTLLTFGGCTFEGISSDLVMLELPARFGSPRTLARSEDATPATPSSQAQPAFPEAVGDDGAAKGDGQEASAPEAAPPPQAVPESAQDVPVIAPKDCKVMISFNEATAGTLAVKLTNYLNQHGQKAFCTAVYCPAIGGGHVWRQVTNDGVATCRAYVMLMTDGWDKSDECQVESEMAYTRHVKKSLELLVPVRFESFSVHLEDDKHWNLRLATMQHISYKSDQQVLEDVLKVVQRLR